MAVHLANEASSPKLEKQRALIEATIEAISEHGLSNVTLAKVAARAGVTAAMVNFHFSGKEALLLATLEHVSKGFAMAIERAVSEAGDDPADALLALIDTMLDLKVASPGSVSVWYAFISESWARADYQRVCGDADQAYDDTVADLFKRVLSEHADRRIDADAVAAGLVGILDSAWQEILFTPTEFDRMAAKRRCHAFLASICPARFEMPTQVTGPNLSTKPTAAGDLVVPGHTLPAWTYQNEEVFALEREHIFMPSWQLVCHVNDVPKTGDFVTFELLGERAFVIRGKGKRLLAFHNVCRHRAHEVVTGVKGNCKRAITCPYHGWSYELDGSLRGVPSEDRFPAFDRKDYGLKHLDLEIFAGFVFIRFKSEGPGVAERYAPFAEEIAHYPMDDLVASSDFWYQPAEHCDWKNVLDNYLEDYHFPTGHPGLASLMERKYDKDVSANGVSRLSHVMKKKLQPGWSVRHYQRLLPACEHLPEKQRRRWSYITMFPGVSIELYPEQIQFFQVLPLATGKSVIRGRSYHWPHESREMRAARYLNDRINTQVQNEDNVLTASVQRGLASSSYDFGLLSETEFITAGFQSWVREKVPVAGLRQAPAVGSVAKRNRMLSR